MNVNDGKIVHSLQHFVHLIELLSDLGSLFSCCKPFGFPDLLPLNFLGDYRSWFVFALKNLAGWKTKLFIPYNDDYKPYPGSIQEKPLQSAESRGS